MLSASVNWCLSTGLSDNEQWNLPFFKTDRFRLWDFQKLFTVLFTCYDTAILLSHNLRLQRYLKFILSTKWFWIMSLHCGVQRKIPALSILDMQLFFSFTVMTNDKHLKKLTLACWSSIFSFFARWYSFRMQMAMIGTESYDKHTGHCCKSGDR